MLLIKHISVVLVLLILSTTLLSQDKINREEEYKIIKSNLNDPTYLDSLEWILGNCIYRQDMSHIDSIWISGNSIFNNFSGFQLNLFKYADSRCFTESLTKIQFLSKYSIILFEVDYTKKPVDPDGSEMIACIKNINNYNIIKTLGVSGESFSNKELIIFLKKWKLDFRIRAISDAYCEIIIKNSQIT